MSTFETAVALLTSAISANVTGDEAGMFFELSLLLEDTAVEDVDVLFGAVLGLAASALVEQTAEPLTFFRNLARADALIEGSDKLTN